MSVTILPHPQGTTDTIDALIRDAERALDDELRLEEAARAADALERHHLLQRLHGRVRDLRVELA